MPDTEERRKAEFAAQVAAAMTKQQQMLQTQAPTTSGQAQQAAVPGYREGAGTSGPRARQPVEVPMRAAIRTHERVETPEEREARFLRKAQERAAAEGKGMQQSSVADDAKSTSPPADIELDEPLTLANAGQRIPDAMGNKLADVIGRPSPEQRAVNEARLFSARNATDRWALENRENAAAAARLIGGPGLGNAAIAASNAGGEVLAGMDASRNERQPVQMQREFSNDTEKEAYLDRVRKAQQNAAK